MTEATKHAHMYILNIFLIKYNNLDKLKKEIISLKYEVSKNEMFFHFFCNMTIITIHIN